MLNFNIVFAIPFSYKSFDLYFQMWLLLTFAFCFSSVQSLPGYRLPGDVIPQNYRLECLADIEEPNFNFSGKVWIKVKKIYLLFLKKVISLLLAYLKLEGE